MANEHSSASSLPSSTVSLLDRSTHFPSVLLIFSLLLALDSALSIQYRTTLPTLTWDSIHQNISIGDSLLFILFFGLFMTIGVGVSRYIADSLAHITIAPIWWRLFPTELSTSPHYGYVRPHVLREEAHIEQNKFYYDLYKEFVDSKNQRKSTEWKLASTAFACLLLGLISLIVLPLYGYPTYLHQVVHSYPDASETILTLAFVILSAIWLYPRLHDDLASDWIYCLPLYIKVEEKRRKEREMFRP